MSANASGRFTSSVESVPLEKITFLKIFATSRGQDLIFSIKWRLVMVVGKRIEATFELGEKSDWAKKTLKDFSKNLQCLLSFE